ncbi:hypothetical protein [Streptacidiphilus fuscans]|uniref:Uncharacterized protein n=1 Tax=Streptacidiphilus fuscans TaxID=2789292 RepID=A0A931FCH1_9ACTN|nr:hypothetical protein [Streptacidiphilus fuscans]MBF9066426.1 hypothetical protein [Streptacidiphilus fuscans]
MSVRLVLDPDEMYRVIVNGKLLEGQPGRPLRFETERDARDMLARRAALFSIPPRKLGEHR